MLSLGEALFMGVGFLVLGGTAVWAFFRNEIKEVTEERDALLVRLAARVVEEYGE